MSRRVVHCSLKVLPCSEPCQFRQSDKTGKYLVEKELWRIEHAEDIGKTKPIPGCAGWAGARATGDPGKMCETNPIFRLRIADLVQTHGDTRPSGCAGRNVQNKAKLGQDGESGGRRTGRGESCETKPISRSRISDCGLRIGDRPAADLLYKQTQFPARAGRARGQRGVGRGPNMQNEPKFGRGGRREPPLFQYSIVPPFQSDGNYEKQSQIWAGWDIWGTARQRGANCARQSQFRPAGPPGRRSRNSFCPGGSGAS
jgi:hypothetical protein